MVTLTEQPNGALRLEIDKRRPDWAHDLECLIDRNGGDDLANLQGALDAAGYIGDRKSTRLNSSH